MNLVAEGVLIIPVGMAGGILWLMAVSRQVFLSHTSELRQLPKSRSFVEAAQDAVIRAECVPVDMAYFSADPRPPAEVCCDAVLSTDAFVAIVGFRYGSMVPDHPELSYTELEFRTAIEANKMVLVFLLDDEDVLGGDSFGVDSRHMAFRRRFSDSGVTWKTVSTPAELELAVYHALVNLDRFRGPVVSVPPLRGYEVDRLGLMAELVEVVTGSGPDAVRTTAALWGAGGFGKTTMARLLVHRQDVQERFPEVVWVSVGEEAVGPKLAEKVADAVEELSGERPGLTDPVAAGARLGRVLGDRQVLLVVDDVWTSAQVEPFLVGGPAAMRLFTTRIRRVLPRSVKLVVVDVMDHGEAHEVLTSGGTIKASRAVVEGLLEATGRWPLLLEMVNSAVRDDLDTGRHAEESMGEILHELRTKGPSVLDIDDEQERNTAVSRTIGVSLSRLTDQQRECYLELGIFRKGVAIPVPVLARYFTATAATAGWSEFQTRRYCQHLAALALVSDYHDNRIKQHDVIHAYLSEQTRPRHSELHRALIDAHRDLVPDEGGMSAWWRLPSEQDYLWAWLPTHLHDAGLDQELLACLHHPGWLVGKLEQVGPAGLEADLALSEDPLSRALHTVVCQNAHVLTPLDPPGSLAATLATRLSGDGPTQALADRLVAGIPTLHLRAITPLPDLPHPALSRVLTGHTDGVSALAVAPDGCWLASASGMEVRVWDPETGATRLTLTGHTQPVKALVVAPDGSWLASADTGGMFLGLGPEINNEVRIWDPTTGAERHVLTGHTRGVWALVVAPDGSWLASADNSGQVRIWDPNTGAERCHIVAGRVGRTKTLVVAPDGSWLASPSDGQVQVWDPVTGAAFRTLSGHTDEVGALVVAPDGSWLASAGHDGQVRIWDPVTGAERCHIVTEHTGWAQTLAVAPDGSWLASTSGCGPWADGDVRIWDSATGAVHHILTGHTGGVGALVVAPDGSWLASAGHDGQVRIWDPATGAVRHILTGHTGGVGALVVAPDGSWLVSAGDDEEVRVWPLDGSLLASASNDGQVRAIGAEHRLIATDHTGKMTALKVTPDGSWLASISNDGQLRIWDPATGAEHRHIATDHPDWVKKALVVAPDGSWLASIGGDGQLRIWDPATGAVRHILTGHTHEVQALVMTPDGSRLASLSDDGQMLAWDPVTGAVHHILTEEIGWVEMLAVAPDGSWLASTDNDDEIQIRDPVTGAVRHTLTSHTHEVRALAVAPDSSRLASADDHGEIRIWDPTTGTHLTSLRVADSLFHLSLTSTTLTAAGKHGLYFLALCPGIESGQTP